MRWRHSLLQGWPPPRRHRHRYHRVLAPNSPLRAAVTADGREEAPSPQAPTKSVSATDEEQRTGSPARYLSAMLLARLFGSVPLVCPNCGANMRIIAFITEAAPVEQILLALGEPPRPPPISPARGPPAWDEAPEPARDWDRVAQPEPGPSARLGFPIRYPLSVQDLGMTQRDL